MIIKQRNRESYQTTWQAMRDLTSVRDSNTADELWLVQHDPVFTQGQAGKAEHILNPGDIPVVQTDRGGQVTYHGPGQIVAYVLFDLRRLGIGIRRLVQNMEQAVIDTLREYDINAARRDDAPGVYVDNAKICAIGLRVRRGCSYHGIAFNVAMDTEPFSRINPCGFQNLKITQIRDFVPDINIEDVEKRLVAHVERVFAIEHAP